MADIWAEEQINLDVVNDADVQHFYYDEYGAHVDAENGNKTTIDSNGTHIFKNGQTVAEYGNDINLFNTLTGDVAFHVGTADEETENVLTQSAIFNNDEHTVVFDIDGEKIGTPINIICSILGEIKLSLQFIAGTSGTASTTRDLFTATYTYNASGSVLTIERNVSALTGDISATVKYSKVGYASKCDVNGMINAYLGFFAGGHSTQIGDLIEYNGTKTLENNVVTDLKTFTLPAGTWVVTAQMFFTAGSSTSTNARAYISISDSSQSPDHKAYQRVRSIVSNDMALNVSRTIKTETDKDLYIVAVQNTTSAHSAEWYCTAVRIA